MRFCAGFAGCTADWPSVINYRNYFRVAKRKKSKEALGLLRQQAVPAFRALEDAIMDSSRRSRIARNGSRTNRTQKSENGKLITLSLCAVGTFLEW
jgi:hypothetical protein